MESDILIVGAGVLGLSTAVHLAPSNQDGKNPTKVTLLDVRPYDPSPVRGGASHDINKMIRADYEDAFYTELCYEALDAWTSDPDFVDADILHQTGWVVFNDKTSPTSTQRIRDNFKNTSRPDPTVDITVDEIKGKWGRVLSQSDFDVYKPAYYNPMTAWVDSRRAMRIMVERALKGGVKYEVDEVERLVLDDGNEGVQGVYGKSGKLYKAKKVLLATGAWTSKLMAPLEESLGLPDEQRVDSQVYGYAVCVAQIQLTDEEKERYGQIPIAIYGNEVDLLPPTKDGLLKFNTLRYSNVDGAGSGRTITSPAHQDQSVISNDMKEKAMERIKSVTPEILENGRSVDIWRMCWDSRTPDGNLLITRHPNAALSNLYIANGAAQGWKFLPVIGKYVANVVRGESNGEEKDRRWAWKMKGSQP